MSDDHGELEPLAEDAVERRMSVSYAVISPEHEADCLEALCEGYVRLNQIVIRSQPNAYPCCLTCGEYSYVPPVNCYTYKLGLRRQRGTDPACQHVRGCFELQKSGKGTCIDLACALAAFLREKENDRGARVVIEHQFDEKGDHKPGLYHAIVMKGDGSIVDPQVQVQEAEAAFNSTGGELAIGCACSAGGDGDEAAAE